MTNHHSSLRLKPLVCACFLQVILLTGSFTSPTVAQSTVTLAPVGGVPIVQNVGQWSELVDLAVGAFADGPWLDADGLLLMVGGQGLGDGLGLGEDLGKRSAVRITIVGAQPGGGWTPSRRLAGPTISYFVGADAARHHSAVPVWGEARRGLSDGSEFVVTGGGQLGWNWRIENALTGSGLSDGGRDSNSPVAHRLRVEGARALRPGPSGSVIVDTPSGPIDLPPLSADAQTSHIVLESAEDGSRIEISPDDNVESADGAEQSIDRPLSARSRSVADWETEHAAARKRVDASGLDWATYFGGSGAEKLFTLDVDLDGSVYVSGSTTSMDLPVTPGAFDGSLRGIQSAYVAKLSSDGARMEYLTFLGGTGTDYVKAIELDDETGDLIVGGDTTSTDFPTSADAYRPAAGGGWEAFLVRLNSAGTGLRYSSYVGGSSNDYVEDLHVGQGGAVTLLLETWSRDLPTHAHAAFATYRGGSDAFVIRFEPPGMVPGIATYIGGAGDDCHDCSLAVGADDTIYVAGWTNSDDLPVSRGAFSESRKGDDGYVLALERNGERIRYGTYLGGSGSDCTLDCEIVVDSGGTVVIFGSTSSTDFPTTPGAFAPRLSGGTDSFLASISRDGTSLGFSTLFGGSGNETGHRVVPRSDGIWVMGWTNSLDLPTTPDAFMASRSGADDLFLAIISPDAGSMRYSTYLGGSAGECEFNCGMVVRDGAFIVGATTYSTDAPVTSGVFAGRSAGRAEGYVARLSPGEDSVPTSPTMTPTPVTPPPTPTSTSTPTATLATSTASTPTPTATLVTPEASPPGSVRYLPINSKMAHLGVVYDVEMAAPSGRCVPARRREHVRRSAEVPLVAQHPGR